MKTVNKSSNRVRQWILTGVALLAGLGLEQVFAETVEQPKAVPGGHVANAPNADSVALDQNGKIFFKASRPASKGSKGVKKKQDENAAAESNDEKIEQPVKVTVIGEPVRSQQAGTECR